MEQIYRQTYTITDLHVDCFGRARPSAIAFLAQSAAGGHCNLLKLDWETLATRNLFWAIIRQRVQVNRLPLRGETVTVETWPLPTTRAAYPRATVCYDAEGNELFRVMGLWILMDLQTRAMVIPGKSGVELEGITRGNELAAPGSILPKPLENSLPRTVVFSELDRNGHMNNTRYLDWVMDLLPAPFHKAHPLRDFVICYHAEALEGQKITLDWQLTDGPCLQVDGHREKTDVPGKQERVFSAQFHF